MTKNKRLFIARRRHKKSQGWLAEQMGVSQPYIASLEKEAPFSDEQAKELAKYLEVSADYLQDNSNLLEEEQAEYNSYIRPIKLPRLEARPTTVFPDREYFEGNDDKFAHSDEGVIAMRVKVVPAKAQLGYLRGFADPEYYENFDYEVIPVEKEARGTYLGFETTGWSMVNLTTDQWAQKSIFPGRVAIGRELNRELWKSKLHIHSNDAWVVVHKTDGILTKEIIKHDTETGIITVHSWNPDKDQYPDEDLHLDDIAQLFNIVQIVDKRR